MTKIIMNGCNGKMGQVITRLVSEDNECEIVAGFDVNDSIENKIFKIATTVYGAKDVEFSDEAKETIALYQKYGWDKLPICMAKTQNSLSDDAKLVGRPVDFTIHVRNINISRGAGFIVALTGEIMTMPGLPKVPAATKIDVDESGKITGLF